MRVDRRLAAFVLLLGGALAWWAWPREDGATEPAAAPRPIRPPGPPRRHGPFVPGLDFDDEPPRAESPRRDEGTSATPHAPDGSAPTGAAVLAGRIRQLDAVCREAGERCAERVTLRHSSEAQAVFSVGLTPVSGEVALVSVAGSMGIPADSAWARCIREDLEGRVVSLKVPLTEPFGGPCVARGQPTTVLPGDLGLKPVVKQCLTGAHERDFVELSADLVLEYASVTVEHVVVTGPPEVDAWTRRCIEAAGPHRIEVPPDEGYRTPDRIEDFVTIWVSELDDTDQDEAPPVVWSDPPMPSLRALAPRWPPPPPGPEEGEAAEALYEQARQAPREALEDRLADLQECVRVAPGYAPCYRQLGSVAALLAARESSAEKMKFAREAYELYVELAPPDDPYLDRVKAILEAAR